MDLGFLDINLRDGKTGPQVGQRLAADGIALIFVTGNLRAISDGPAGTMGLFTKSLDRVGVSSIVSYADDLRSKAPSRPLPGFSSSGGSMIVC